jgi:hypothetical protein
MYDSMKPIIRYCVDCKKEFYCLGCVSSETFEACHCKECSIKLDHSWWIEDCHKMDSKEVVVEYL